MPGTVLDMNYDKTKDPKKVWHPGAKERRYQGELSQQDAHMAWGLRVKYGLSNKVIVDPVENNFSGVVEVGVEVEAWLEEI